MSNFQRNPNDRLTSSNPNLNLMDANNQTSDLNRSRFEASGICCLNLMGASGSGKTTLLGRTLAALHNSLQAGVLEAGMTTELDTDYLRVHDVPVVPITTGRTCHLDADMVANGLDQLDLEALDLIFVENVGSLICPAEYPLGEHANVVLVSVTQGEDTPLKYPVMFYEADCVVITKTDLIPHLKFDLDRLVDNIHQTRPGVPIIVVSAESGQGLPDWLHWVQSQVMAELAVSQKGMVIRN